MNGLKEEDGGTPVQNIRVSVSSSIMSLLSFYLFPEAFNKCYATFLFAWWQLEDEHTLNNEGAESFLVSNPERIVKAGFEKSCG